MPCLAALIALITPRLVIVSLWLLSDWFYGVFSSVLWPVLGFLFAPTTLLWYSAVENWYGGAWETWHLLIALVTLVIDFSPAGSKRDR
ncbi:MAG: hypothetical protein ACE5G0_07175 [Rhodothermales bacterium]